MISLAMRLSPEWEGVEMTSSKVIFSAEEEDEAERMGGRSEEEWVDLGFVSSDEAMHRGSMGVG